MSQQVIKNVTATGNTFDVPVKVEGDQFLKCFNAQLTLVIPNGLSLIGPLATPTSNIISVPKGVYNNTSDIWYVGDLEVGQVVNANFTFRVDDINLADTDGRFYITMTLTSSCTESNTSDNLVTVVVATSEICLSTDVSIGAQSFNVSAKTGSISIG